MGIKKINIIYYSSIELRDGKRLLGIIESLVPEGGLEICQTIGHLNSRLRRPRYDRSTAVLAAASVEDMTALLSLEELLRDIPIILILPDRKEETVKKGHRLFPRYLSYADSDFLDVKAVLEKMIKHLGSRTIQGNSIGSKPALRSPGRKAGTLMT